MTTNLKNINLNSENTRREIFSYLNKNNIVLSEYDNIKNINDLEIIKNNEYIICPQIGGVRSIIMFIKLPNNVYYSVGFPKHNFNKRDTVKIFPIDVTVHPSLYNGTIMEGIFVKEDNKKYYIVNEVHLLAGETQLLKSKIDRLNNLRETLKRLITPSLNYYIHVTRYYRTDPDSLLKAYEFAKENNSIQNFVFYPSLYGQKIYEYTIMDSDLIDHIVRISTFIMEKTSNPDVYNLYELGIDKKIGIAYIPNTNKSKECKQWFVERNKKKLIVKCILDNEMDRWIPIEVINSDEYE